MQVRKHKSLQTKVHYKGFFSTIMIGNYAIFPYIC
jgi:hypothetical protein